MKFVAPSNPREKAIYILLHYWRYILITLAAVIITNIISKALINDPNKMEKVSYIVTKRVITQGEQVKENDLTVVEFIKSYEPENAYKQSEIKTVVGKAFLVNLPAGTIITKGVIGQFEEAPVLRIAQNAPGKKVIYFRGSDFHTLPPIIKAQNYVDIMAYSTKDEKLPPTPVISRAMVVDIEYKEDLGGIKEIGFALDDKEITNVLAKLNNDWILNIAIHPL